MTTFIYKAKRGPEKTEEGELEADSRASALLALDRMGLSPITVAERPASARPAHVRQATVAPLRVRGRDVTVFTRQLGSLIKSGVPILRALRTIIDQTSNQRLRTVVEGMEATIRDGSMLSAAMQRYPSVFPALYLDMVRAGESGGMLDVSLARLADAREKEEDARRKVQAAMAYPLLVLLVGAGTVFVLLSFFLPKIVVLFKDFAHLPLPTRILIETSDFFHAYWYWLVLVMLLGAAIFKRLSAGERGRAFLDALILRVPLVRDFVVQADIARFARTLALLVNAGIVIDKSLQLSGNTLSNTILRAELDAARISTVQKGAPLSEGIKRAAHFPPFVANMTAVGEEAGRLDEALLEVAAFYEKEVEQQARLITSLIEPLLILVVGAMVGFIVAAMLLPIFELGTGLR
ncbi:MAG: type II secretion system F family protein [Verrucomicrobia bacterium]|nr:type II secretion system F family protein [Verrucomicrobiota bacterium]